jgi:hypothetical protein
MRNRWKIDPYIKEVFSSPNSNSYFFGYYNYSPISKDGTKMLAHKIFFEGRMPSKDDEVEIGYFNLETQKWHKISESRAFNWQQGAMLQWLGPDYNDKFIYNDVEQNKFISKIVDIKNNSSRTIPYAIYGIDSKGTFSISLNFERCYWTRAYSYASIRNKNWDQNVPSNDGIFKIDLSTGEAKRIISIQKILDLSKENDQKPHWFEHIMLNPKGDRFSFYHRFGNNSDFSTRVYTADINGCNVWEHPYSRGDQYSHLGWQDDKSYVLYTKPMSTRESSYKKFEESNNRNKFLVSLYRKYVKPVIPMRLSKIVMNSNSYYSLTIDQNEIIEEINPKVLNQDGHPSFSKNGRYMLTDTYEDESSFRYLLLYDTFLKKVIELGSFFSTYNSCGWRADLHPRFSFNENYIIIDSTHNGYHQVIVFEIDWAMLESQ